MKRPSILIVKTGSASQPVVEEHGDYHRWFINAMGAPRRFSMVSVVEGESLPSLKGVDAILVTGSALSVCQPAPWMLQTGEQLKEAAEQGKAVLGICFGHQLLANAHGSPVILNRRGREIGSIRVTLSPDGLADPLFNGLGRELEVLATHTDVVSAVPKGATLLASNENTAVQALAYGPRIRSLQFHPEISPGCLTTLLDTRREEIRSEGLDPEAIEEQIRATPVGAQILRNFEERLI